MGKTIFTEEGSQLKVSRRFDAPVELVWRAWTEAELLDKWWAPKPWKSKTTHMSFKSGGYRLYAMISPEGEQHWSRNDYKEIDKHNFFSGQDSFSDEKGVINFELPTSQYSHRFLRLNNETEIQSDLIYESEQALETVIKMGMKQGLEMACVNLDELLIKLK